MKYRKKLLIAAAAALTVAAATGLTILAATNSGDQTNPLITLSYLNNQFAPQIKSELRGEIAAAEADLVKRFDDAVASGAAAPSVPDASHAGGADVFAVVTLSRGQTVKCSIGAELLLRIGGAASVGEAPGLVDSTGGTTLAEGGELAVNHLYMVTIDGNGIKASSDTVKVMIRGDHTVT
ncbi:MAG: hypothetical protein LBJ84_00865 [Oscillospiraceae bacterium]|jgi:hypothetical protein|nr:hypothetical protein [Oscillospiraceae bacterium]